MLLIATKLTPRRRANLEKLADYLESLPEDYNHFAMDSFYEHEGECDLAREAGIETIADELGSDTARDTLFANSIESFLGNCGTSACAIGHGPAAGIPLAKSHIGRAKLDGVEYVESIDFDAYALAFVPSSSGPIWRWLFSDEWVAVDNHHWGAAARIRFLLDKGGVPKDYDYPDRDWTIEGEARALPLYEPYLVDRRALAPAI